MVLLLCLWDNLKFWRVFSLGKESGEGETVSTSSFRESSYYCDDRGGGGGGGGDHSMNVPFTIPSNTSATAKVSCSYYNLTGNQSKPSLEQNDYRMEKVEKVSKMRDNPWDTDEDDDCSSYKTDEVRS